MPITFIPFDGWQPSGSYFGEGWNTASGIFPSYGGHRPWPKFVATGTGVADGPMTGRHVHVWTPAIGGVTYSPDAQTLFTGSQTKLYTVDPSTGAFTNISRGAAYTAHPAGWRFVSVGNDIWAANWVDLLQRRTANAGNFADGSVSTFKPHPRFLTTVREHLVVGNLSDAGRFQDELAWSDADDATNFDPAATGSTSTSIAGAKRLVAIPGQITGLVGGQYALVFKRRGIFYGEYAGPPQVFNFDVLSANVGTAIPSSLIVTRFGIFFFGPDGVYQIQGLSEPQKISDPGIDEFLFGNPSSAPVGTSPETFTSSFREDTQMFAFQFPDRPLVGWAFSTWDDTANVSVILYNPVTQKWATSPASDAGEVSVVFSRPTALTGFDAVAALTYSGSNSLYAPLSRTGSVRAATLGLNFRPVNVDSESRKARGNQMGQSMLHGFLPIFSKTSTGGAPLTESVTVEAFLDPHGSITATETMTYDKRNPISGYYPFALPGRFFRITINCTAGEDFASFEGGFAHFEELAG